MSLEAMPRFRPRCLVWVADWDAEGLAEDAVDLVVDWDEGLEDRQVDLAVLAPSDQSGPAVRVFDLCARFRV